MRFFPGQRIIFITICAALLSFSACDAPEPTEVPAVETAEAPSVEQGSEAEPEPTEAAVKLDQEQAQEELALPEQDEELTQEQLDQFVAISKELKTMQEGLKGEMASITSPEEFQEFQERVTAQVQEKVEEAGMEFETFLLITQRVAADPELQAELAAQLD